MGAMQRMLRADGPWALARAAALASLAGLLFLLHGRWGIEGVEVPDPLMYTNLGNLLFWVGFLMALPLLALLSGRAFCAVCPLGTINEALSRRGLKRPFPAWLRNDWPKAALLVATMGLLALARIHHWPGATFWYVLGWVALAAGMGLLFRGRSLCGYACPVGGMLGLYSRLAPVTVGVADPGVCSSCSGRECVRGKERWVTVAAGRLRAAVRADRPGCGVNLKPWDLGGSGRCLLCGNCLRACPHGNAVLRGRPFAATLWSERFARFSETVIAAALLGFLLLSFARFWPALGAALSFPGTAVSALLGPLLGAGVGVGAGRAVFLLWGGFLLPFLLLALPAAWTRWREGAPEGVPPGKGGFRFWREPSHPAMAADEDEGEVSRAESVAGRMAAFLPAFIPVLAGGHLVLALVKMNAKLGYLPLAVADPGGARAFTAVEELGTIPRPGLLVDLSPLKWSLAAAFAAAIVLSAVTAVRIARRENVPAAPFLLGVAVVALAVGGGFRAWLF